MHVGLYSILNYLARFRFSLPIIFWQDLGSRQLVLVTHNLFAFNIGTSQPLGTLPKFPITLGLKIIYIDVMLVQGPLYFNLLLDHDYVYVMGAPVFSLFRVMCFLRKGRIVTIN